MADIIKAEFQTRESWTMSTAAAMTVPIEPNFFYILLCAIEKYT